MKIFTKKINKAVIKTVPLIRAADTRPVLRHDFFPEIYANIFLCAKKKSGKTTVIYNVIQKCANKNTIVMVFCSTLYKDDTYKSIMKYCKLNGIVFIGHTSLMSEDDGHDLLLELIDDLKEDDGEDDEEVKASKKSIIICDDSDDEDEKKAKKSKYQSPEYIFILDDLSNELKKPSLTAFLKKHRHFKSKIIVSTQYLNDVAPGSRKQMDYFLLFKGHPQGKLDEIARDADISIDMETYYKLYKNATLKKFSFFYIDTITNSYRKNFDIEYSIDEN